MGDFFDSIVGTNGRNVKNIARFNCRRCPTHRKLLRWAFSSLIMKEIILSNGCVALVDDEDFEYLNQWKWYPHKSKKTYYVIRMENKKSIQMHRLIMNAPEGLVVDHINHKGWDNQKKNLRLATHTQNMHNKSPYGKSKYAGVYLDPYYDNLIKSTGKKKRYNRRKKWKAVIKINGKQKALGRFVSEIEAARCFDEYAKEYRGEFAYLNNV